MHVARERIEAILDIPKPTNVSQLRQFLGIVNYYAKFIKNYAQLVNPLYQLLKKDQKWNWSSQQDDAFAKVKKGLISHNVLMHYDLELPVKITCDASPIGIDAVLSHVLPCGTEKPVAFVSRSLTQAEKGYSQLDREALALVFGVKKLHQYVYGRNFILETDHKPLTFIFGSKKGLPQMAANRVQR